MRLGSGDFCRFWREDQKAHLLTLDSRQWFCKQGIKRGIPRAKAEFHVCGKSPEKAPMKRQKPSIGIRSGRSYMAPILIGQGLAYTKAAGTASHILIWWIFSHGEFLYSRKIARPNPTRPTRGLRRLVAGSPVRVDFHQGQIILRIVHS